MPFRSSYLLYFVTVADEGHMARAAEQLSLSQPALSQAIAKLESDLGFLLLERHTRGVTPTPAGELFLERAREAVAAEANAVQLAQALARARSGTVEFGFVGAPPSVDSPGSLTAFAESHPEIDLRYRELRSRAVRRPCGCRRSTLRSATCRRQMRTSGRSWCESSRGQCSHEAAIRWRVAAS